MTRKSLFLFYFYFIFWLLKRNHQLAKFLPKEHLGTLEFSFTSKISPQKEIFKN
jgi:hypothetical protein